MCFFFSFLGINAVPRQSSNSVRICVRLAIYCIFLLCLLISSSLTSSGILGSRSIWGSLSHSFIHGARFSSVIGFRCLRIFYQGWGRDEGLSECLMMATVNPNRSLDFGEIARLCHAACFSPSRRRSGLRRGVARIRMRTEAGKMPESLTFPIKNGLGVSNDRFGVKLCWICHMLVTA